jgi:cytochrome P450
MMAAHDTLASSLSSFVYFLAVNPPWQEKLREEAPKHSASPEANRCPMSGSTICR